MFAYLRWFSLLGFLVSCTFPGLQGMLNVFGGLCVVLLLHCTIFEKETVKLPRYVCITLLLYFLITLLFVLYPPLVRGSLPFKVTFSTSWHSLRWLAAGGVLFSLLRSTCSLTYVMLLYPLFLFLNIVWAYASKWVWGLSSYELLGNSNIIGMRIYVAMFAALVILIVPSLRKHPLQRWMVASGYVFIAIVPMFFLLNTHVDLSLDASIIDNHNHAWMYTLPMILGLSQSLLVIVQNRANAYPSWIVFFLILILPLTLYVMTILPWRVYLLHQTAVITLSVGTLVWRLFTSTSLYRSMALIIFLVCGVIFLFWIGSRHTIVMLPIVFVFLTAAQFWGLRVGLLRVFAASSILIAAWIAAGFPGVPDDPYWRQDSRQILWMHSLKLGMAHPWIGHGYGFRAFQAAWEGTEPVMPPWLEGKADPVLLKFRPMHAHNIIVEIFVERGLVGLVSALLLWGVVLCFLARESHSKHREYSRFASLGFVFFLLFPFHQMLDYTVQGTAESYYCLFFVLLLTPGNLLAGSSSSVNRYGFYPWLATASQG